MLEKLIKSYLIFKAFWSRSPKFLINIFNSYVRSGLEYACNVWSPHLLKDIDLIENVQRKFTKRIPGLKNMSYPKRLESLNMQSLELRRIIQDLTLVYKIFHGLVDLDFDQFFERKTSSTRDNGFALYKKKFKTTIAQNFFSNRVVNIWNYLPPEVVSAPSLSTFKHRVAQVNLSRFLKGRGLEVSG